MELAELVYNPGSTQEVNRSSSESSVSTMFVLIALANMEEFNGFTTPFLAHAILPNQ